MTKPESADAASQIERTVEVSNRRGLHARASAKFCAVAGSFDATVTVRRDDVEVGGCSIMGLLMLGAGKGSEITIIAKGPQASLAIETLARLVDEKFGEGE